MPWIFRNTSSAKLPVYPNDNSWNSAPGPQIGTIFPGEHYVSLESTPQYIKITHPETGVLLEAYHKYLAIKFRNSSGVLTKGFLDLTMSQKDNYYWQFQKGMWRYAISDVTLDGKTYQKFNITRRTPYYKPDGSLGGYLDPVTFPHILCTYSQTGASKHNTIRADRAWHSTGKVYSKLQGEYFFVDMQWEQGSMASNMTVRPRA